MPNPTERPYPRLALVMGFVILFAAAAVYAGWTPMGGLAVVAATGLFLGTREALVRHFRRLDAARSASGLPVAWAGSTLPSLSAADLRASMGSVFSKSVRALAVPAHATDSVASQDRASQNRATSRSEAPARPRPSA